MKNRLTSKMYLTEAEAKAKGLGSVQEQINRYNSAIVDSVKPFQVRASCGHVVIRKMREATAGVPYTPETILDAPNGRACPACEGMGQ
jgi:hypothetical protein